MSKPKKWKGGIRPVGHLAVTWRQLKTIKFWTESEANIFLATEIFYAYGVHFNATDVRVWAHTIHNYGEHRAHFILRLFSVCTTMSIQKSNGTWALADCTHRYWLSTSTSIYSIKLLFKKLHNAMEHQPTNYCVRKLHNLCKNFTQLV